MCRLWVSAVQAGYLPQICRIYLLNTFWFCVLVQADAVGFNLCGRTENLLEAPSFPHLASGYLWLAMLASWKFCVANAGEEAGIHRYWLNSTQASVWGSSFFHDVNSANNPSKICCKYCVFIFSNSLLGCRNIAQQLGLYSVNQSG